ncbi:hypothetical protein RFF05_08290 [Bengtsoniella intestinalis]|uniref:hypothetical protein n=1 Tax=Bengtsoniella intestinalis TaxID=3073143 RepID=UPI00391F46FA
MNRKILSLLTLSITLLTLTACQNTPESMSGGEVTGPTSTLFMFFGIVFAVSIALGVALWYARTHHEIHPNWIKILDCGFVALFSGTMFPLNFETMFTSGRGVSIILYVYVIYKNCCSIKATTDKVTTQVALFFGSAMAGLVARYCLELGEVSNAENFTPIHLAIFFGVYVCIFGVAKRVEMPR